MLFNVDIVGYGVVAQTQDGSPPFAVYILRVQQPLQSWTCYRRHYNFQVLVSELTDAGFQCPELASDNAEDLSNEYLEAVRLQLQHWLHQLLQIPGLADSFIVRNFMCTEPNMPPAHMDLYWAVEYRDNTDEMDIDMLFDRHLDEREGQEDEDEDEDGEGKPQPGGGGGLHAPGGYGDLPGIDQTDIQQSSLLPVGSLCGKSAEFGSYLAAMSVGPPGGLAHPELLGGGGGGGGDYGPGAMAMTPATPGGGAGNGALKRPAGGGGGGGEAAAAAAAGAGRPPPAPQRKVGLDSFKIIKVIGKGSFGKVFLAREKRTRQLYALKVLRKDNVVKRNQVEHTRTERNVLAYVRHPFIVGLNMAFQTRDKLFFVLDYCAGGELFFHLGKVGKFPEPRARFYAAQIVLALDYVHKLDIIYRDLKPENVLLDHAGHVRLTDFGLSKEGVTENAAGAHSFCGTPEYLAPEILDRRGHGRAVDWWSLGALLYEMLTGLPPFYCRDREKLFEKIRRAELNYPAYLSENSVSLLQGLLTRDPARRLGSGAEDSAAIQRHPFFAEVDWAKLARGGLSPPWRPPVASSLDTSQFDREFTSMPIVSPGGAGAGSYLGRSHGGGGPGGGGGAGHNDDTFAGFTFQDKSGPMYQATPGSSPPPHGAHAHHDPHAQHAMGGAGGAAGNGGGAGGGGGPGAAAAAAPAGYHPQAHLYPHHHHPQHLAPGPAHHAHGHGHGHGLAPHPPIPEGAALVAEPPPHYAGGGGGPVAAGHPHPHPHHGGAQHGGGGAYHPDGAAMGLGGIASGLAGSHAHAGHGGGGGAAGDW